MKDPIMKWTTMFFLFGALLAFALSLAGVLSLVTALFLVIMMVISLGALGEYRRVL